MVNVGKDVDELKSKVTITDVAKYAGVSRATAGRVIGNYGNVSEDARRRVEQAAAELAYFPNAMAQGLRSQKTNTIAIIADRISNRFFSNVIASIEKEAFEKGYSVIVCNTHENIEIELRQLKMLQNKRVDAIIIAPVCSAEALAKRGDFGLYHSDIPMVYIDRAVDGMNLKKNLIISDNFGGAYKATEYLIKLGHRHIAVMTTQMFPTERQRVEGYRAALHDHNISFSGENLLVPDKGDMSKGNMLIKELMLLHEEYTALMIMNIDFLPSVLAGLREQGKQIPDDLSLIVWDETDLTSHLQLTTVAQFPEFMGKMAAQKAIALIEGKEEEDIGIKNLPTELHIGNSCKNIP